MISKKKIFNKEGSIAHSLFQDKKHSKVHFLVYFQIIKSIILFVINTAYQNNELYQVSMEFKLKIMEQMFSDNMLLSCVR